MARPDAIPAHVTAFTECDSRRELHSAHTYSLYVAADSDGERWLEVRIPEYLVITVAAAMANWVVAEPCVIENAEPGVIVELPKR